MIRRSLPARVALLLAMLAWMLGSVGAFAHVLKVRHAVCADHGQLIELGESQPDGLARGPELLAPSSDEHDHGCALIVHAACEGDPLGAEIVALAPTLSPEEAPPWVPPTMAPLANAPKTSPPLCS